MAKVCAGLLDRKYKAETFYLESYTPLNIVNVFWHLKSLADAILIFKISGNRNSHVPSHWSELELTTNSSGIWWFENYIVYQYSWYQKLLAKSLNDMIIKYIKENMSKHFLFHFLKWWIHINVLSYPQSIVV